jgi:hypothetical protein
MSAIRGDRPQLSGQLMSGSKLDEHRPALFAGLKVRFHSFSLMRREFTLKIGYELPSQVKTPAVHGRTSLPLDFFTRAA